MRIAILGGTFDPIHNGHLSAAQSVASAFNVDEVHFLPAFSPPHKQSRDITSPFHRFAMVALATLPFDHFQASTMEVDALEKRYTVDTLRVMAERYPGAELLFVVGTDMFQEITTWKDYREIFNLTNLVVVNRPGFPFRTDLVPYQTLKENQTAELPQGYTVFHLPFVEQPISSTEIRQRFREGSDVRSWVPPEVFSYIERHNLYA